MLFAVIFADNEEQAEARQRLMKDHLDFLEKHQASIRAAGPLQDTESRKGAGGLWLVEACLAEAVRWLFNIFPSVERSGFSGGASLRPVRASSEC